jgi:toxin ParE1/3/4
MRFEVFLTEDANRDLEDIYAYVADHDAPGKAEAILGRIEEIIERLSANPHRGS